MSEIPAGAIILFVGHSKMSHKHCLLFLLGVKMAPRETENNAYANFWRHQQSVLWYVMAFSEVANSVKQYWLYHCY